MRALIQKTEINKSNIHGRGVFAKCNIKRGEVIEECPILKTNWINADNPKGIRDYTFGWMDFRHRCVIPLGYGALCNHSYSPNAKCISDTKRNLKIFIAKRNIKRREEILIEYEESYWRWKKVKPIKNIAK